MAVTMRQVAELAGVSLKSVSRVVNGEPNVSDELRHKVTTAIDQLGWQPNALARTLRTGRTETVAVIVPDLRSGWVAALAQALVIEADRRGLRTAIEPCGRDRNRAVQVLTEQSTSFDGAIVVGGIHGEDVSSAGEGLCRSVGSRPSGLTALRRPAEVSAWIWIRRPTSSAGICGR
ncbi:LacI family DNA-binding transcriptional regulator [Actinomyces sp. Z16]|uniref:LacI family DNA-binding transcriptional regulator n=1 Tax=Actinomyces sp. Z16 TaxID=2079536 RepID=UPI000D5A10EF|nr:LacI family DNA-binding transcriptional regulator [Actinomyces sp. Z16]